MAEERARVIVKRVSRRTHHYGSAWKVAYADFSTAMMALFVVLWLLTQADMRMRQQIAQYFREPGGSGEAGLADDGTPRRPLGGPPRLVRQGQGEQEMLDERRRAIDDTLERVARHNQQLRGMRD